MKHMYCKLRLGNFLSQNRASWSWVPTVALVAVVGFSQVTKSENNLPTMAAIEAHGHVLARIPLRFLLVEKAMPEWPQQMVSAAQDCLNNAAAPYGITFRLNLLSAPEIGDEHLRLWLSSDVPRNFQGTKLRLHKSSESSHLNVIYVDRIMGPEGERYGSNVVIDPTTNEKGEVTSFYGSRDIQISTFATGIVLAHEIMHAWGGLLERQHQNNLMNDGNMYCILDAGQIEAAVRHSRGGRGEVKN